MKKRENVRVSAKSLTALAVVAISLALLTGAWRRAPSAALIVLAISAAVGLTSIDVIYVARGALLPIYLGDALVEVALICGWGVTGFLTTVPGETAST